MFCSIKIVFLLISVKKGVLKFLLNQMANQKFIKTTLRLKFCPKLILKLLKRQIRQYFFAIPPLEKNIEIFLYSNFSKVQKQLRNSPFKLLCLQNIITLKIWSDRIMVITDTPPLI